MEQQQRRDRYYGTLLGALLGDALGASFIEWECVSPESFSHALRRRRLGGLVGVDFVLAAAEALLESDGRSSSVILDALGERRALEPADKSRRIHQVLGVVRQGVEWDRAERLLSSRVGVPRDLASVFVIPAALLAAGAASPATEQLHAIQATITLVGASPASVAYAGAMLVAAGRPVSGTLDPAGMLGPLRHMLQGSDAEAVVALIERLDDGLLPGDLLRQIGRIQGPTSAPIAIYAFLQHGARFLDAVYAALRPGGETSEQGLLAGALAGAWLGGSRIPAELVDRMPEVSRIRALADGLWFRSQLNERGGGQSERD